MMPLERSIPLYHRVYMVLRQQIMDGRFPADRPMPGELALAESFGVSRITIRRTLGMLAEEGLVERRRGAGTFARPSFGATVQGNLAGMVENLIAYGLSTKVKLLAFGYVAPPPAVARDMGLRADEVAQMAVRLRSYRGNPLSRLVTYVPEDIGRSFSKVDLAAEPLLRLLERAGVAVASADQTITAELADATTAPDLELAVGAPLLRVTRLVRDRDGRVVEHLTALYRPDQYEYRMTMERVPGAGDAKIWQPAS